MPAANTRRVGFIALFISFPYVNAAFYHSASPLASPISVDTFHSIASKIQDAEKTTIEPVVKKEIIRELQGKRIRKCVCLCTIYEV